MTHSSQRRAELCLTLHHRQQLPGAHRHRNCPQQSLTAFVGVAIVRHRHKSDSGACHVFI